MDRDVDRGIRAARAARDPLSALRARLLAAESARRAGRGAMATALLGRIGKVSSSSLPPIVRARCALLADLLSAALPAEVVRRHVAATRLEGLALFAPEVAGPSGSDLHGAVEDVVEILRSCQTADDDGAVLTDVCARLRLRLNAAGVGVFGRERGGLVLLASDGSARLDSRIGDRVVAAGQLITPHIRDEVIEGERRSGTVGTPWARSSDAGRSGHRPMCRGRRCSSRWRRPPPVPPSRRRSHDAPKVPPKALASCSASAARWWRFVRRWSAQRRRPSPS